MRWALERRGVPADEVDLINPHGTSTPLGDKREAEAIWTVFGDRAARDRQSLAVSGTKSMTGHMMGAAGAFEAFATVMTVAEQCVPADDQLPRVRPRGGRVGRRRGDADADPLRAVQQHRPGRPQRRDHLQALGRPLSARLTIRRPIRRGRPVPGPSASEPRHRSIGKPQSRRALADPARRAVVTGLGAVMPIGNDFETYWSNLRNGVTGTRRIQVVRPDRVRGPDRRRGARLRPDRGHGRQDGPPHEPVHPPRDGRGQGGGRGVGHRLRGDEPRTSAIGSAWS